MWRMRIKHWEKVFVGEYARNGGNASKAYQVAKQDCAWATCQAEGSKTSRLPHIMEELERVRLTGITKRFLDVEERRQFLADTVRANPQTVMADKPHLAQAVTVTRRILDTGEVEEKVSVKLPDKLKALALDAAMAGELAPAQAGAASPIASALDALMGLATPTPAPAPAPAPLALPPVDDGADDLL